MRFKQGQPLRRETVRQAPDSGDAFNVFPNVGENIRESGRRTHFEPTEV